MLNEKQINGLKNSIGTIIKISNESFDLGSGILVSYSENDEEIRLFLDNGYLVLNKEKNAK